MSKRKLQRMLGVAINIANAAHVGTYDRGGKPYILHPLHLMNRVLHDEELASIAVLHDTIEDTNWVSIPMLEGMGFTQRVLDAVDLLTHKEGVSYVDYILDIAENSDATVVKMLDLEHNSDITRLKGMTDKDLKRMEKYQKAYIVLGKAKDDREMLS